MTESLQLYFWIITIKWKGLNLSPCPPLAKFILNNTRIHSPALAKLAKGAIVQRQLPPGPCSPASFWKKMNPFKSWHKNIHTLSGKEKINYNHKLSFPNCLSRFRGFWNYFFWGHFPDPKRLLHNHCAHLLTISNHSVPRQPLKKHLDLQPVIVHWASSNSSLTHIFILYLDYLTLNINKIH